MKKVWSSTKGFTSDGAPAKQIFSNAYFIPGSSNVKPASTPSTTIDTTYGVWWGTSSDDDNNQSTSGYNQDNTLAVGMKVNGKIIYKCYGQTNNVLSHLSPSGLYFIDNGNGTYTFCDANGNVIIPPGKTKSTYSFDTSTDPTKSTDVATFIKGTSGYISSSALTNPAFLKPTIN